MTRRSKPTRPTYDDKILWTVCPACRAKDGYKCNAIARNGGVLSGFKLSFPHLERVELAYGNAIRSKGLPQKEEVARGDLDTANDLS